MNWLIRSFCDVILQVLRVAFINLAGDFIACFGINVGASFPTLYSVQDGTYSSLSDVLGSYINDEGKSSGINATDLFDVMFPATAFRTIMIVLGISLALLLATFGILKASFAQHSKRSPLEVLGRFTIALICTVMSYRIFIVIEYFFNMIYIEFQKVAISNDVLFNNGEHIADTAKEGYALNQKALSDAISNSTKSFFDTTTVGKIFSTVGDAAAANTIGTIFFTLVCLVSIGAIIINFLKLILEMAERYVVLGVLFYTCPLPFATIADPDSKIFKSWIQMVMSECILMIMNAFFLNTFIGAMLSFNSQKMMEATGMKTNVETSGQINAVTYIVAMMLLIGWLQVGQKMDQHLRALGLSTAQAGGSLAGAVISSAMLMKDGARMVKGAKNGISKAKAKRDIAAGKVPGGAAGAIGGMFGGDSKFGQDAFNDITSGLHNSGNAADKRMAEKLGNSQKNIDMGKIKSGNGKASMPLKDGGTLKMANAEAYGKMSDREKAGYKKFGSGYAAVTGTEGAPNATATSIRNLMANDEVRSVTASSAKAHGFSQDPDSAHGIQFESSGAGFRGMSTDCDVIGAYSTETHSSNILSRNFGDTSSVNTQYCPFVADEDGHYDYNSVYSGFGLQPEFPEMTELGGGFSSSELNNTFGGDGLTVESVHAIAWDDTNAEKFDEVFIQNGSLPIEVTMSNGTTRTGVMTPELAWDPSLTPPEGAIHGVVGDCNVIFSERNAWEKTVFGSEKGPMDSYANGRAKFSDYLTERPISVPETASTDLFQHYVTNDVGKNSRETLNDFGNKMADSINSNGNISR